MEVSRLESCQELEKELEEFQNERKKMKEVIGKIGGSQSSVKNKLINIIFLTIVLMVFVLGAILHKISITLSLEIGVLLISLKIAWMIHEQQKINHFQFWMLNSLEYRINEISKKIRKLEEVINNVRIIEK
jgi:hypothetical protein